MKTTGCNHSLLLKVVLFCFLKKLLISLPSGRKCLNLFVFNSHLQFRINRVCRPWSSAVVWSVPTVFPWQSGSASSLSSCPLSVDVSVSLLSLLVTTCGLALFSVSLFVSWKLCWVPLSGRFLPDVLKGAHFLVGDQQPVLTEVKKKSNLNEC